MSTEPKTKKSTEPKPQESPVSSIILQCKVLKNGLRAGGGVSAAGKILNLPQDVAEYHQSQGEVKIIGTK
jgi:hypothetical protein